MRTDKQTGKWAAKQPAASFNASTLVARHNKQQWYTFEFVLSLLIRA